MIPLPVVYIGIQHCPPPHGDFALYNLLTEIPGHPEGSTVSEQTIRNLGYIPCAIGGGHDNQASR